jgi:hypothetical protein
LIIGPGSVRRFYALFAIAFTAYSVGWIIGWMALRGNIGSLAGLLLGTGAMAWLLVRAVPNTLGYFAGGWVESYVAGMRPDRLLGFAVTKQERMRLAMLLWGVCYGLGLGAGLGLAFYYCQSQARVLLGQGDQAQEP